MARHEARIDIGSARGRIADDEVDCLAPVEFFHGLGEGRNGDEQGNCEDPSQAFRVQSNGSDLSWLENMADGWLIEIAGFLTGHILLPACWTLPPSRKQTMCHIQGIICDHSLLVVITHVSAR